MTDISLDEHGQVGGGKRSFRRAVRRLLLVGICWYRGRSYNESNAAALAPQAVVEDLRESPGTSSRGHVFFRI